MAIARSGATWPSGTASSMRRAASSSTCTCSSPGAACGAASLRNCCRRRSRMGARSSPYVRPLRGTYTADHLAALYRLIFEYMTCFLRTGAPRRAFLRSLRYRPTGAVRAEVDGRPSGLADEHGPDAEPHEEQATEAVEQVEAMAHLRAVAVDDRHGDDRHEAVEHVELRRDEPCPRRARLRAPPARRWSARPRR